MPSALISLLNHHSSRTQAHIFQCVWFQRHLKTARVLQRQNLNTDREEDSEVVCVALIPVAKTDLRSDPIKFIMS